MSQNTVRISFGNASYIDVEIDDELADGIKHKINEESHLLLEESPTTRIKRARIARSDIHAFSTNREVLLG